MAKVHMGAVQNLDTAAAFNKMQDFAKGLDDQAKVRADKKGIYGSTKKNLFGFVSIRKERRQNLQNELKAIGEKHFGKGTLLGLAWTSKINDMVSSGRLHKNTEFRGSDFKELVSHLEVAYEMAVDTGQISDASTKPELNVGVEMESTTKQQMADASQPLPYTKQDARETLAWLNSHANDRIAAREVAPRKYEFYVDNGGRPTGQEEHDPVAERANVGTALHFIRHSARVDTLRTELKVVRGKLGDTNNPPSDLDRDQLKTEASRLEEQLAEHISEYTDQYPDTIAFDVLASAQSGVKSAYAGLQRGGVKGEQLAEMLKQQLHVG